MTLKNKLMLAICPLMLATAACSTTGPQSESAMKANAKDASSQIEEATNVVQRMEQEPGMKAAIQNAKGIFIVPTYGQGALGVGASGGEGVLLVKSGNTWGEPAFYNFGGMSIGLQAGGEGGPLAFILNNERAIQQFRNQNNFQFNASAGVTVVDWSKTAARDWSQADVIAWSDKKGLFGGAAIGLQDVVFDERDTAGYYGKEVTVQEVFSGKLKAPEKNAASLKQALSQGSASLSGGAGEESESENK